MYVSVTHWYLTAIKHSCPCMHTATDNTCIIATSVDPVSVLVCVLSLMTDIAGPGTEGPVGVLISLESPPPPPPPVSIGVAIGLVTAGVAIVSASTVCPPDEDLLLDESEEPLVVGDTSEREESNSIKTHTLSLSPCSYYCIFCINPTHWSEVTRLGSDVYISLAFNNQLIL